ncbi:hypothetical protein A5819_003760 [Enterococcus sp. 7E2_DIV0204]|uniref:MobP2 family relaxase n=1 Tax=unclassified Enterococcus TaxID=2608891 RepID=UPI000A346671|nr:MULTISPECIES: MobP2 family relaxase [unclassified Enterococcus]OTN83780.1 hypothetical protein A5819_003760 [Enterococcus sp. 7E2_DIV0204]OTP47151.1 hypothetical protein A5884_003688 [Enterococcus sp. 7D2_DIV0200]
MVGIVYASKFIAGSNQTFQKYIDYIDRSEAVRTSHVQEFNMIDFDGYNHYMGNPEKTSALFSSSTNALTNGQKQELKQQFVQAQKNDSVMWQDVISFDNQWLEKYGLYDPGANTLDETRIMDSVRSSMKQILEQEGMSQSAIWSGAIHYNTDNFHVHIAIVEPEPTREYGTFRNKKTGQTYTARRGYRSQTYLSDFRSKVANHLINRDHTLGKLNELIRHKIGSKEIQFTKLPDRHLKAQIASIHTRLPRDMRQWKYNMNGLQEVRPQINTFISDYIDAYHFDSMEELKLLLREEAIFRKELYGDGEKTKGQWEDTEKNKLDELYSSLGNTLLKELAEIEKVERGNKNGTMTRKISSKSMEQSSHRRTLSALKRAFSRNMKEARLNQLAYQKMKRENEQENSRSR